MMCSTLVEDGDWLGGTVDGRHPEPVDMVNIPLFIGFSTSNRWLGMGFLKHQEYGLVWFLFAGSLGKGFGMSKIQ